MGIILREEDEAKLQFLTLQWSHPKCLASRHMPRGRGTLMRARGAKAGWCWGSCVMLAILVRAAKRAKRWLNSYVFPLMVLLAKGKAGSGVDLPRIPIVVVARISIYFGPYMQARQGLDMCVTNTVYLLGCYYVVTHADTNFLQIFSERFGALTHKPIKYSATVPS